MQRFSKQLCKCGKPKSQVAIICWECRKRQLKRKCKICDKEFQYKKSTDKKTCSVRCAYKLRGKQNRDIQSKQTYRKCEWCGIEKLAPPSQINRRFCSSRCWSKYNSGKNNAFWRGGVTPDKQSFSSQRKWKQCCKHIWKRDNATCRRCEQRFNHTQQTFEVHHIRPFYTGKQRTDYSNLILVCRKCHCWIHSKRNTKSEYLNLSDKK